MEKPQVKVAVRYSRNGAERVWCHSLISETCGDGAADAASLIRLFYLAVSCSGGCASPRAGATGSSSSGRRPSFRVRLQVVPCRPLGAQVEVAPAQGQSLLSFLEQKCREDNGVFQLRADFSAPSGDGFVHVRVAFPGTATFCTSREAQTSNADLSTGGSAEGPPMLIEQFECEASDNIAKLKRMIEQRTQFPASKCVLLLEAWRFHDQVRMDNVAAALDRAGAFLQCHLAVSCAYVFLRREGQGHCEPTGARSLTLLLPRCVQGASVRPMKFDPQQTLQDLRWAVQSVSGLPPAGTTLMFNSSSSKPFRWSQSDETLDALGFTDGCTLKVDYGLSEDIVRGSTFDIPLEAPTFGDAKELYSLAAKQLGMLDPSQLALFVNNTAIPCSTDLSCLSLADGFVISAYVAWSLQLSISVLACSSCSRGAITSASGSEVSPSIFQPLACLSSDTIAEVRERAISAEATSRPEISARLRGSKVFAIAMSNWTAGSDDCSSLGALARLLGHFSPCSDSARLSRLGIADGVHLVFVPDPNLLVEIELRTGGESCEVRKLRVPSTSRLSELSVLLEQDLRAQPIADLPPIENLCCQWSVPRSRCLAPRQASPPRFSTPASATSPSSAARNVVALVGTAVAKGKRRISGSFSSDESSKRRRGGGGAGVDTSHLEVQDNEFVGDLHAQHPLGPPEMPSTFMCPISHDVMSDPVIVVGSGNTYDRKSIEQHFRRRHSDPLSNVEMRRATDRRLVPNNMLRSQINEAARAQVDLRLIASLGERRRGGSCCYLGADGNYGLGVGPMAASLRWCASLLRGDEDAPTPP